MRTCLLDWVKGAAKCRSVVTNFTSREITK